MSDDINITVGARVRAARKDAGLSITDIVPKLRNPITIQQFARYETGKSRWPVALLVDAARILKIDLGKLFEEEPDNA